MGKETLADKLAKKTFESETIQKNWRGHMLAFGPLLEQAFEENYQAKVHLTAALNYISRRDVKAGFEKLKILSKYCKCDADQSALLFFYGVCYEFAGDKDNMLSCYINSTKYGIKFYLPYLKVAKSAHADSVFEVAEENYRSAIACYDGVELNEQGRIILASAYTNLASCLTMMHRFSEAEEALRYSEALQPVQRGRNATKAILYGAMRNVDEAELLVNHMLADEEMYAEHTQKMVWKILDGKHPHFSPVAISEESIDAFWCWFAETADQMSIKAQDGQYDSIAADIEDQLKNVFPFMERPCEVGIMPTEYGYEITFADFFAVSLKEGYAQLIVACPESLAAKWKFTVEH